MQIPLLTYLNTSPCSSAHVQRCICINTYVCACKRAWKHISTYVCAYMCTRMQMRVSTCNICRHVYNKCADAHRRHVKYTYIHTHTSTYMYCDRYTLKQAGLLQDTDPYGPGMFPAHPGASIRGKDMGTGKSPRFAPMGVELF